MQLVEIRDSVNKCTMHLNLEQIVAIGAVGNKWQVFTTAPDLTLIVDEPTLNALLTSLCKIEKSHV